MNKQPTRSIRNARLAFRKATFMGILSALVLILSLQTSEGGSATWKLNPTRGGWKKAANWTPKTVPNGVSDIATFAASTLTDVSISTDSLEIDSVVFASGASAFFITAPVAGGPFTFSGAGVINNSGVTQNFVTHRYFSPGFSFNNQATVGRRTMFTVGEDPPSSIWFNNQASAGSGTFMILGTTGFDDGHSYLYFYNDTSAGNASVTNTGGSGFDGEGGETAFYDNSTAANGTFTNTASTHGFAYSGGVTSFHDNSTAADAVIRNRGAGGPSKVGGFTYFADTSTAGNATITCEGSADPEAYRAAVLYFLGTSNAGTATLIANAGRHDAPGGLIVFYDGATGNQARVELFGNGTLDLTDVDVTVGSLEGSGIVLPGIHTLTVGTNGLNTSFDGLIEDNGSLIKVGSGTLTLTGANTYTGGTTVSEGFLRIDNKAGSATGSGPVQVTGGTLGGGGTTSGDTTVGGGAGGSIAPGSGATTLSVEGALNFEADGSYVWRVKTRANKADQVVAKGVTISDGALFNTIAINNAQIPPGTTFTAIANTAATPINGTFANLVDNGTFVLGDNTFQVSYEGGDGNDLTLTVVP